MSSLVRTYLAMCRQGPESFRGWLLLALLVPVSLLYGWLGRLRLAGYRCGLFASYRSRLPVISVGNLAAGGKGKTPLVDYIVRYLSGQGLQVVVVSRGYGGSSRSRVARIKPDLASPLAAARFGDEPVLLQRRNPQIEVLTARKRADGIRYANEQLEADVVVLDDGFQHLAVQRELDIMMLDARRPFGNGWPLPAGELREFAGAYRRADLLVLSRCSEQDCLPPRFSGPVVRTCHRLETFANDLEGRRVPLEALQGKTGFAFSGIAAPEGFFAALRDSGLQLVQQLALPDHVGYGPKLITRLGRLAAGADFLVTTEKDGVKLAAGMFAQPCYQVPLKLEIVDGEEQLQQTLLQSVSQESTMNLSEDLLKILACPKCKGSVSLKDDQSGIICPACQLVYPVRDEIPVMLIDEATPI